MSNFISIIVVALIISISGGVLNAQIDFVKLKWDEALKLSEAQSKPIFVDVYTTWCGPCRKMDATTFQDSVVGDYMNTHFINMKWDAENYKYIELAREYGVTGYPTLMYIDHTGNVMKRRTGMHDRDRLIELSDSVLKFANADYSSLLEELKNSGSAQHEKLVTTMREFDGFQFAQKQEMYRMLFDIYTKQDSVTVDEYSIVIDNLYDLDHLKFAVKHYPNGPKLKSDDRRSIMRYRSKIKSKIDNNFADALRYKDRPLMEETAQINLLFDSKVNSNNRVQNAAYENRSKLLEFYAKHRYTEPYAPLAAEMIKREIIPYNPTMTNQRDAMRKGMQEKVLDGASGVPNHPRARLMDEQKYSFKMAYMLQIVVDNYAEFYDDTALLEQALEWSELSTTYVDLPENRLSRAKVLSKLGYKEEAEMHLNKGLASIYINDQIKNNINKFKAQINTK
jgi:thiol-disulfide isomerase/thioredoxin